MFLSLVLSAKCRNTVAMTVQSDPRLHAKPIFEESLRLSKLKSSLKGQRKIKTRQLLLLQKSKESQSLKNLSQGVLSGPKQARAKSWPQLNLNTIDGRSRIYDHSRGIKIQNRREFQTLPRLRRHKYRRLTLLLEASQVLPLSTMPALRRFQAALVRNTILSPSSM